MEVGPLQAYASGAWRGAGAAAAAEPGGLAKSGMGRGCGARSWMCKSHSGMPRIPHVHSLPCTGAGVAPASNPRPGPPERKGTSQGHCQTPQCHLVKRPRLRGLPN